MVTIIFISVNYMKIKDYLKEAKKYQKNPKRSKLDRLTYLTLGYAGESGEVADEIKKAWRNKDGRITKSRKLKLLQEMGDVANILLRMCKELDCPFEELLDIHLDKLKEKEKPF